MMALVSKDLYSARSGIGVILLFAVVFGVLFRDTWTGPMIVTLLFANIGNSTLTWDEQCQWNTFAVSSGIPGGHWCCPSSSPGWCSWSSEPSSV